MADRVIVFFLSSGKPVTVNYLDMLQNYLFPQIKELPPDIIAQLGDTPPHRSTIVRHVLDEHLPGRWT